MEMVTNPKNVGVVYEEKAEVIKLLKECLDFNPHVGLVGEEEENPENAIRHEDLFVIRSFNGDKPTKKSNMYGYKGKSTIIPITKKFFVNIGSGRLLAIALYCMCLILLAVYYHQVVYYYKPEVHPIKHNVSAFLFWVLAIPYAILLPVALLLEPGILVGRRNDPRFDVFRAISLKRKQFAKKPEENSTQQTPETQPIQEEQPAEPVNEKREKLLSEIADRLAIARITRKEISMLETSLVEFNRQIPLIKIFFPKYLAKIENRISYDTYIFLKNKETGMIEKQWCHDCYSFRDFPRDYHCKKCGMCVSHMDHHCAWLGQCVGKKNYFPFFVLIWVAFLQVYISFAFMLLKCYDMYKDYTKDQTAFVDWRRMSEVPMSELMFNVFMLSNPIPLVIIPILAFLSFFSTQLVYQHCWFSRSQVTTRDEMHQYHAIFKIPNIYDTGDKLKNCLSKWGLKITPQIHWNTERDLMAERLYFVPKEENKKKD